MFIPGYLQSSRLMKDCSGTDCNGVTPAVQCHGHCCQDRQGPYGGQPDSGPAFIISLESAWSHSQSETSGESIGQSYSDHQQNHCCHHSWSNKFRISHSFKIYLHMCALLLKHRILSFLSPILSLFLPQCCSSYLHDHSLP